MAYIFNDENTLAQIESGKAVVVDFWATWCGPCQRVAPIVEQLADEYDGKVLIGKYNVDEGVTVAAQYGIRSIPTLLFFKGGQLVDRHVGAASKAVLEAKLQKLL